MDRGLLAPRRVAATLACLSAVLAAAVPIASGAENQRQKRPNIIVVNTDDQDDSLVGMPIAQRRLAGRGTTFSNFTTVDSLCCPSRVTLLTGQYTHNHGVLGNTIDTGGGFHLFGAQGNALPVWLRRAGYRTAHLGKYLNDYGFTRPRYVPPGWNEWHTLTRGTDLLRWGYVLNRNRRLARYGDWGSGLPARSYLTDVLGRIGGRLIKRWAPSRRPFFLLFEPTSPHTEGAPPGASRDPRPAPRDLGRFDGAVLPRPPSFNEADVSDKPPELRYPALSDEAIAEMDREYRSRLESLLSVDRALGSLIGRLHDLGELDRTVILLTSDNGYLLGQHRLYGKNWPYEESMQVPLVIRGPGFPKAAVRLQPAANIDLAPTILDLANARAGRPQDGRSLVELARNPGVGVERDLLYENFIRYGRQQFVALRDRRYVWIDRLVSDRDELYDLQADPFELENLSDEPAYAGIKADLIARLDRLRACGGAACR